MAKPVLLYYQPEKENAPKVRFAAMHSEIRLREVKPEEYGLSIGALSRGEQVSGEAYRGKTFADEMLVMAGFSDQQIQSFLQMLRSLKTSQAILKAVMTDTNADWDSVSLHDELCAERAAMEQAVAAAQEEKKTN